MDVVDFAALLKESMGLDISSIGTSAIVRAVQERQAQSRIADAKQYLMFARDNLAERQALVEAVVVPETWFFRDSEAFAALARICLDLRRETPGRAVRVLSIPSSTGEEPFSMAMALIDAGLSSNGCQIEAADISRRALAHCERGEYGKNSFRGTDLRFRDRHFMPSASGFRVNDNVRALVRFRQGNLLTDSFFSSAEPYDVVFCRNLFIYFDRETQQCGIAILQRLLAPGGVLFVAPSETAMLLAHGFAPTDSPLAFAMRRAVTPPPAPRPLPAPRSRPKPKVAAPAVSARAIPPSPRHRETPAAPTPRSSALPVPPLVLLETAAGLANEGRFAEATPICEEHLRVHGPSAQAFYLLGLVRDATGDQAGALTCYRKALYLDAHHQDALIHMALLLEQQGNVTSAKALRQRVRRQPDLETA
jgi:chemotaxis protein methyltransferase WspC